MEGHARPWKGVEGHVQGARTNKEVVLVDALIEVAAQRKEGEHAQDVADPEAFGRLERHRLHYEAADDSEEKGELIAQSDYWRLLEKLADKVAHAPVLLAGDRAPDATRQLLAHDLGAPAHALRRGGWAWAALLELAELCTNTLADIGEEWLQRGPTQRSAGEAAAATRLLRLVGQISVQAVLEDLEDSIFCRGRCSRRLVHRGRIIHRGHNGGGAISGIVRVWRRRA